MRQQVLDYINSISLGSFTLSGELPWNESGTELYLKNPKRIYVDVTQFDTEPLVQTLDGLNIDTDVASVGVFFSADAKQLPANYDSVISDLRAAKNAIEMVGNHRRECTVATSMVNDMLVTEMQFRFTKLS